MPRLTQTTIAFSIAFALSGMATSAQALGLGNLNLRSHLGEPLRAVVPVRLDAGETLEAACVRVSMRGADDGIPAIPGVIAGVDRAANGGTLLLLNTRGAVNEPIARVTLDVGCVSPITRDFVMLIDPPSSAPVSCGIAPAAGSAKSADHIFSRL